MAKCFLTEYSFSFAVLVKKKKLDVTRERFNTGKYFLTTSG